MRGGGVELEWNVMVCVCVNGNDVSDGYLQENACV